MSRRQTLKKTAAVFLGIALTVGSAGCDFVLTDGQKDLEQTVATVNISDSLAQDEVYGKYADDVATLIENGGLSTDVSKRDLIAYYMSTGYQYVENYGYTYEDTFNMLMDGLVSRKIMLQYAVAYYLKAGEADGVTAAACEEYVKNAINAATGKEKELLEAHPEVLTMKYILTNGGKTDEASMKEYNLAVYSLRKSLNNTLDSYEQSLIEAEEESHDHGSGRTTPTGVDTAKEDYYPVSNGELDYGVYTGRNALDSCGQYEAVEGSTPAYRKKSYNSFLANLQSYNLVQDEEDTKDILSLDYYYVELSSFL